MTKEMDNSRPGVSTDGPQNVIDGASAAGDNFAPLGMASRGDGDPMDRGQSNVNWGKWLYAAKPGIE